MGRLTEQDLAARLAYIDAARADFPDYAADFLTIRAKEAAVIAGEEGGGRLVPFRINSIQRKAHEKAEDQLARIGKVRLLIPKARQHGMSTYIGGRGYHKVSGRTGYQAFILTHRDDATRNLFNMVKRFHDNMNPLLKPHTKHSNEYALVFDRLDSGFGVGTAGGKEVGRSNMFQFLHGSEVAYWPNASKHFQGLGQAVPEARDTEIWLESTGNGPGGVFHAQVQKALKGLTEYEVLFLPWFDNDEYQKAVRSSLELSPEDIDYQQMHGLTDEQMQWRSDKLNEMATPEIGAEGAAVAFQREYPATLEECFAFTDGASFIKGEWVTRARKTVAEVNAAAPRIWGVDPSWIGSDRFTVIERQARKARKLDSWKNSRIPASANRLIIMMRKHQPDAVVVDATGVGAGIADILLATDFDWPVTIIVALVGEQADEPERYYNRRAELYGRVKEWLTEPPYPDLEDEDEWHMDLVCTQTKPDPSRYRTKLESKDDIRSRDGLSPDLADALSLTFYTISFKKRDSLDDRPVVW